jgi:hypothetical protein
MGFRLASLALLCALSCGDNVHTRRGALVLSPVVGLYTDETGATATFTVALTAPPAGELIVTITSQNLEEGSAFPRVLIFNASTSPGLSRSAASSFASSFISSWLVPLLKSMPRLSSRLSVPPTLWNASARRLLAHACTSRLFVSTEVVTLPFA